MGATAALRYILQMVLLWTRYKLMKYNIIKWRIDTAGCNFGVNTVLSSLLGSSWQHLLFCGPYGLLHLKSVSVCDQ